MWQWSVCSRLKSKWGLRAWRECYVRSRWASRKGGPWREGSSSMPQKGLSCPGFMGHCSQSAGTDRWWHAAPPPTLSSGGESTDLSPPSSLFWNTFCTPPPLGRVPSHLGGPFSLSFSPFWDPATWPRPPPSLLPFPPCGQPGWVCKILGWYTVVFFLVI